MAKPRARALGSVAGRGKALKGGRSLPVPPFQGWVPLECMSQGLRPGLCCLALAGPFPDLSLCATYEYRFERFTVFKPPALPEVSDLSAFFCVLRIFHIALNLPTIRPARACLCDRALKGRPFPHGVFCRFQ